MKRISRCIVVTLLLLPALTLAQGRSGPDDGSGTVLLAACLSAIGVADEKPISLQQHIEAAYCGGRIMGMVDMHGLDGAQGGPRLFCVPEQITLAQMVRVVVRYLNRHQEDLHESGIVLATRAFTQVFPCPESPAPAPGRE